MIASEHNIQLVLMSHCLEKLNGSVFMPNFHFMWHEADLVYITKSGYSTEFEVKISRGDFKADANKRCGRIWKAEYLQQGKGVNYFYYVVPKGLLNLSDIPSHAGLIEVDLNEYWSNRISYIKKAPMLHKEKKEWIKNHIYEKAYYRYLDKITRPAIRKSDEELYKLKYPEEKNG